MTAAATVRLGTRGSALALWQAHTVADRLTASGTRVEIVTIRTAGDRLQQAPLTEIGGKQLFVKEIEDALLRHEIDVAVHSAKDMSAVLPAGLTVAATLPRADPRDALVLPAPQPPPGADAALQALGTSPRVGTGSVRRIRQLAAILPGAHFAPIRGNVDTRLRRLDAGDYAALILAAAGLTRLGLAERITAALDVEVCVPAPGQGTVAVEVRDDDRQTTAAVAALHDPMTGATFAAERALVAALGGGCHLPLGGFARVDGDALELLAVVLSPDGGPPVRVRERGTADAPADLGQRVADALLRGGADRILSAMREEP